jgi:glycine oxidase
MADIVVIGGGVIGLSVARALARRGVRGVVLIERARLGAESSVAAAGILAPQVEADEAGAFFDFACKSRDLYPAFADALREESATDIELDHTGTLYLAFTQEDEDEMRRRLEWQSRAGLAVRFVNRDEARRIEPGISPEIRCGLRFPNDTQVNNRQLLKALAVANRHLGVKLLTGCDARSIRVSHGRVEGIETSQGSVSTPVVVLAAGAWSSFIDSPDIRLPQLRIEPVRGQMLCFETHERLARHVIYSPRGYLVPRVDGRLLAGSTTEHAGFDKSVTSSGIHAIMTSAAEIAPRLAHLPLSDSWAGLRPRAEDNLPVLGPCAEVRGLFYATGHYRNGILLAPITGELIAETIVSGVRPPLLDDFAPDRFRQPGVS